MKKPLLISFFLHIAILLFHDSLFYFFKNSTEKLEPQASINAKTISLKEYNAILAKNKKLKAQQIVQIDEKIKSDSSPDPKQKTFLSSHNQRVDHNTRASKVGKFKNVFEEGSEEKVVSKKTNDLYKFSPEEPKREPASISTPTATGRLRKPASTLAKAGNGESATDDFLEDVAIGTQTLLNAQEFKYYSFYARVREKLSERWQIRLRQEINHIQAQNLSLTNSTHKTSVRVFLKPDGYLKKIQILGSSGLEGLDKAATDAFKLAAPFPNPPKDMLDEEGMLSIRWEFVIVSDDNDNVQFTVDRTGYR